MVILAWLWGLDAQPSPRSFSAFAGSLEGKEISPRDDPRSLRCSYLALLFETKVGATFTGHFLTSVTMQSLLDEAHAIAAALPCATSEETAVQIRLLAPATTSVDEFIDGVSMILGERTVRVMRQLREGDEWKRICGNEIDVEILRCAVREERFGCAEVTEAANQNAVAHCGELVTRVKNALTVWRRTSHHGVEWENEGFQLASTYALHVGNDCRYQISFLKNVLNGDARRLDTVKSAMEDDGFRSVDTLCALCRFVARRIVAEHGSS